ncbi:Bardet-Biedl syndrome 12 protein [Osmerus eperlanus]|uniref:Bardet-Biedl syndrome 12 protein n=1 Tax=Osmerus eperlanus TaxID=29151 RepID=UPI002E0FA611
MSGSTIINQKRHIGLQKLTALSTLAHSFLGPNKRHKFIHDDESGDSVLVRSCFRLLQHLDLSCSVCQLVSETLRSHQKVYHTGTGCLLFLAGAWGRAALECLHRDVAVPHIVSAMSEGLEVCLDACGRSSVFVEDAVCSLAGLEAPDSVTLGPRGSKVTPSQTAALAPSSSLPEHPRTGMLLNRKQRKIKLTHSRHFCSDETENRIGALLTPSADPKDVDISHLAPGVSHGSEIMKLVVEASRMQSENTGSVGCRGVFDVNKLITCTLSGLSEDCTCVQLGCVVQLSDEQASLVHVLQRQRLNVALINGDLGENYHHLGFTKPANVRLVSHELAVTGRGKEDEWIDKVLTILLKLDVNLVLVHGVANEKMSQQCTEHSVLVIERMKPAILKDFAETTGAVAVSYATQLSRYCVGTGARVSAWRDFSQNGGKTSMAVNVAADHTRLVTAILTSHVPAKLQALDDQFWGCAYRLHHALEDGKLLPGAGELEVHCLHHLHKHMEVCRGQRQDKAADNPYSDTVLQLMADGLMDFTSTVMANSGQCSKMEAWTAISNRLQRLDGCVEAPQCDSAGVGLGSSHVLGDGPAGKIYDNYKVKMEAWRRALDLVLLVLLTDTEIITGMEPEPGEENITTL